MTEAPQVTIEPIPTDPPAPNTPEARTPQGELKTSPDKTPTPQTPSDTTKETKDAAPTSKDKETSLLNETGKDTPKGDTPLTGAPEKYESFKAPDGYEFTNESLEGANTLFKELNLSQAGAQRLVDFHAAELKAALEAPQKLWEKTRAEWIEQVKSDPDIGGKLDQVKATVAQAIDGLGDSKLAAEFRQAMDYTGAGNNPAFIRAFYKLAQKVTEGRVVTGGGPTEVKAPNAPPRTAAHALYPNLK